MRRFERIISLVAVIGVLLHAGLLVRHNGVMLDAAFDRIALGFADGVICSSGADGSQAGIPSHSGKLPHCPICLGAAAAVAILTPAVVLPGTCRTASAHMAGVDQQLGQRATIRPQSRAPPLPV